MKFMKLHEMFAGGGARRSARAVLILFALVAALASRASQYSLVTITLTNNTPTTNGAKLTIDGVDWIFTNNVASVPRRILTNTTAAGSATNLNISLTTTRPAGVQAIIHTNATNVIIRSIPGTLLTVTSAGEWSSIINDTLEATNAPVVQVPATIFPTPTRTNIFTLLLDALSAYATNRAPTNAFFLSLYVSTSGDVQVLLNDALTNGAVLGSHVVNSIFNGGALSNRVSNAGTLVGGSITNSTATNSTFGGGALSGRINSTAIVAGGGLSNTVADGFTVTNFTGIGTNTLNDAARGSVLLQVGGSGTYELQWGTTYFAIRDITYGINVLQFTNDAGDVRAQFNTPGGELKTTDALYTGFIFPNASDTYDIGAPGSDFQDLFLSGTATIGALVTTNLHSTGTNRFDLAVSFSATNITSLANGVNLVDPGLKTTLRVSGPTAAYSIDKITRGYDERFLRIRKNDSYTLTIANESGSGGGAATDRVVTGTGANITITNNPGVAEFSYDATLGRWVLGYHSN